MHSEISVQIPFTHSPAQQSRLLLHWPSSGMHSELQTSSPVSGSGIQSRPLQHCSVKAQVSPSSTHTTWLLHRLRSKSGTGVHAPWGGASVPSAEPQQFCEPPSPQISPGPLHGLSS